MIDPYHLEAYGTTAVNYNRDVEVFPVLNAMFEHIKGESPYKSPTDMGVNMVGNCIIDDEAVREASNQEIIRRYFAALCDQRYGKVKPAVVEKIEVLMNQAKISSDDRKTVKMAINRSIETNNQPAVAIELCDGRIVTGKTSKLLGAASAALLNAVKALAELPEETMMIAPETIEPIQKLKVNTLGNHNPRLHTDEALIALAISASTSDVARVAMEQLEKLRGCQAHSTVILSPVDNDIYRKLGIDLTCEPQHNTKKLYHK